MIIKLRLLTILGDFILLVAAYSFSYFLRVNFIFSTDLPFLAFFRTSLLSAVIFVSVLVTLRGYHPQFRFRNFSHIIKIGISSLTATAAFGITYYFAEKAYFSRLLLLYLFTFGSGALILFHLAMQMLEERLIRKGYGRIPMLLIGSHRGIRSFIEELQKNCSPYDPVGILDGYGTSKQEVAGVPVLGKLNRLEEVVEQKGIKVLVQGDQIEQVINLVHFSKQRHLKYYILPYLLGMVQDTLKIEHLELPMITLEAPEEKGMLRKILG